MFILEYTVKVRWVPDGATMMSVPSAQQFIMRPSNWPVGPGPVGVLVPGANVPTLDNFDTAMTGVTTDPGAGSMCADLHTQISASLARIQGFATGGG